MRSHHLISKTNYDMIHQNTNSQPHGNSFGEVTEYSVHPLPQLKHIPAIQYRLSWECTTIMMRKIPSWHYTIMLWWISSTCASMMALLEVILSDKICTLKWKPTRRLQTERKYINNINSWEVSIMFHSMYSEQNGYQLKNVKFQD